MKYAKFSDDFLSDFRLDDNGETLVLTDKRGYTRAIKLLQYEERPQGKWIGDTDYESFQGHYEAYKCNKCSYGLHWRDYYTNDYKFCPNCGADMRGEENEKT